MRKGMKLVPKCKDNIVVIFLCLADGRNIEIARLCMPDDGQMVDNVDCVKEICKSLEKRIGSSM